MFSPSTADHKNDDQTTRRVINFAMNWKYGGVFVGNIHALRTSSYKKLKDSFCPKNKQVIVKLIKRVEKVVYAWGNKQQREPSQLRQIFERPYCIDVSAKKYSPKSSLSCRLIRVKVMAKKLIIDYDILCVSLLHYFQIILYNISFGDFKLKKEL